MNRYEALKHAVKAHAGQVDKCGQPHILHPIAVAESLERRESALGSLECETLSIIALLHDVWEDTDYNAHNGDLTRGEQAALEALTRQEDEPYADYIDRLSRIDYAPFVKLADLWHNLSPERQACLPDKERASLEARYLNARDRIWEALGYEWWPTNPDQEETKGR